jgi:hypothetical protein
MAVGISRFKNEETGEYLDCDSDGNLFTANASESETQMWQFICQPNGDVLFANMANNRYLNFDNQGILNAALLDEVSSHIWDWSNDVIINRNLKKALTVNKQGVLCLEQVNGGNSQKWTMC